ncbi:neurofilament medium polypeptide-like [Pleurodeles waltl]|uniref:neurofilament medium polypeptide-like n=1 Tax=Pleurodeles waltl TaxID=8319 RepID=UPI0037094D86
MTSFIRAAIFLPPLIGAVVSQFLELNNTFSGFSHFHKTLCSLRSSLDTTARSEVKADKQSCTDRLSESPVSLIWKTFVTAPQRVEATTLPPIQGPGHALKAGDWVVIKKHVRKSCLEPRWKGPFQVILTTTTAVKCAGVPNWIHASHTKKVLCPTDEEVEALKLPVPDKAVPSAETEQKRTESEQATAGEKEILLENEESDSLGEDQGESSDSDDEAAGDKEPEAAEGSKKPEAAEGDKEPEAAESDTEPEESNGDEGLEESEKAGEPEQKGAFPETDDTEKEKENVTDSPEGGDKEEQNERVQNSTEKIAGPSNGHGAKRRLSISPIKEKGKESLNEGGRPKVKEKRKEVTVVDQSSSEEKDLTKEESTSEAESKREAKLKRKRIPNRRYSGPEWAYAVNDDWTDEFVSLSIENEEEEEIPIEKKSFIDSVD